MTAMASKRAHSESEAITDDDGPPGPSHVAECESTSFANVLKPDGDDTDA